MTAVGATGRMKNRCGGPPDPHQEVHRLASGRCRGVDGLVCSGIMLSCVGGWTPDNNLRTMKAERGFGDVAVS